MLFSDASGVCSVRILFDNTGAKLKCHHTKNTNPGGIFGYVLCNLLCINRFIRQVLQLSTQYNTQWLPYNLKYKQNVSSETAKT